MNHESLGYIYNKSRVNKLITYIFWLMRFVFIQKQKVVGMKRNEYYQLSLTRPGEREYISY